MSAHILLRRLTTAQARLSNEHLPTLVSSTPAPCTQWKKLSTPSDAGAGNHIATAPALMSAHILLRRLTTAQARLSNEHLPTLVSSTPAPCTQWKTLSTPSDAGAGNHIAAAPALMSAHILLRRLTTAQARLSNEHLPTLVSSTPAPCTQ